MRTLCIGRVTYDISLPLNEFLVEGKKYNDVKKVEGGSGSAGTPAYLLGRWGCESYIAGVIGNDLYGNRIKREYETIGVFTKFLEVNYEKDTIVNYAIINESKGSRTLITDDENSIKLTKNTFEMDDPDGILLDGSEYDASIATLIRYKEAVTMMSATKNTKEVLDLCTKVKYVVCPLDFAEEVTGIKANYNDTNTLVKIYQGLNERFKNNIVITLGNMGTLYCIDNNIKVMPPVNIIPKDSTGVGDVFRGALLYGLISNKKYDVAIKIANMAAGLSTTKVGIKNSIFKFEEIETYAKNINESIY